VVCVHTVASRTMCLLIVCVGYFISDSVDIIACGQLGTMRDVLIHHISVRCVDC